MLKIRFFSYFEIVDTFPFGTYIIFNSFSDLLRVLGKSFESGAGYWSIFLENRQWCNGKQQTDKKLHNDHFLNINGDVSMLYHHRCLYQKLSWRITIEGLQKMYLNNRKSILHCQVAMTSSTDYDFEVTMFLCGYINKLRPHTRDIKRPGW